MLKTKNALLLVDLQNDFCDGGSLAVPHANEVFPLVNTIQDHFDLIIASKDWHPEDHMSFANESQRVGDLISIAGFDQRIWPPHCVAETRGSQFSPLLMTDKIQHIVYKGSDRHVDSYSAFFDNHHLRDTGLHDYLQAHQIQRLTVLGLATDYCVKYTCIDAINLGYDVTVLIDACRGVELRPGDIDAAIAVMKALNIKIQLSTFFI
jgi:nicotinamidase/pyrazinamidase